MPITLRVDQPAGDANDLDPSQVDGNWQSLWGTPIALGIIAGAVVVNGAGLYTVDTEGLAATDDLTTITGAQRIGDEIILSPANDARTIVVKKSSTLRLSGTDFEMDTIACVIKLRWMGTYWRCEGAFYNTNS